VPYTPDKPALAASPDDLRARIPGWGVDADPKDRPSVPRLQFDPNLSGARWELPEQQPEKWPRERSIEHSRLTPVFGTSCPPKGVSGAIRKLSYRRFSEGRAAHWMLLLAADRVEAAGAHVAALLKLHPDPIASGLRGEMKGNGIASRFRKKRTDLKHQWLDPFVVAAPSLLAGLAGYKAVKRLRRR
jgi:hypothetical protein